MLLRLEGISRIGHADERIRSRIIRFFVQTIDDTDDAIFRASKITIQVFAEIRIHDFLTLDKLLLRFFYINIAFIFVQML